MNQQNTPNFPNRNFCRTTSSYGAAKKKKVQSEANSSSTLQLVASEEQFEEVSSALGGERGRTGSASAASPGPENVEQEEVDDLDETTSIADSVEAWNEEVDMEGIEPFEDEEIGKKVDKVFPQRSDSDVIPVIASGSSNNSSQSSKAPSQASTGECSKGESSQSSQVKKVNKGKFGKGKKVSSSFMMSPEGKETVEHFFAMKMRHKEKEKKITPTEHWLLSLASEIDTMPTDKKNWFKVRVHELIAQMTTPCVMPSPSAFSDPQCSSFGSQNFQAGSQNYPMNGGYM